MLKIKWEEHLIAKITKNLYAGKRDWALGRDQWDLKSIRKLHEIL